MLTGKKFCLRQETLGIEQVDGKRQVAMVPAGEVVHVLSGPRPDDRRMIDVLWKGRTLVMFVDDVQTRGEEVKSHGGN